MKNRIFNESIKRCPKIELKLFTVYNATKEHCSFELICVFISKFAAATKNLKTNYTFFVKPTRFFIIQEAQISMTNFSMTLTKLTLTI